MHYSPPSSATRYDAKRELMHLGAYLESVKAAKFAEKEQERQAEKEQRTLKAARIRDLQARLNEKWRRKPWKVGAQHIEQNFEAQVRKLPAADLSPTALYRAQHCLPRNFQSPEQPFVTASRPHFSFGSPEMAKFLSKSAQALYKRREMEHEAEVDKRIKLERARKVVVFESRWEPAQKEGGLFGMPQSSRIHLKPHFSHSTTHSPHLPFPKTYTLLSS